MDEMYRLRGVRRKLQDGAQILNLREQDLLYRQIDPSSEYLWPSIELLATQVINRTPQLTTKVAFWYRNNRPSDKDTVVRLLRERLSLHSADDVFGERLSVDEVGELMDCQMLLDQVQREIKEEKNKKNEKDKKD
ncbi:hypothetical protein F4810DRAFT_725702 [Camillea tinctor]|nr:hypothetical protein F4810DRAFT_725702 [Camillea tinctor]